MRSCGTRFEVSTTGFDQNLLTIGADPLGSPYYTGLRIPSAPPTPPSTRFLYLLAFAQFAPGERGRIVGLRQLLTIGLDVPNPSLEAPSCFYPLEKRITSPIWRFTDGNVSWHLMQVPPGKYNTANPNNREGLQFLYGSTPALLYQSLGPIGGPFAAYVPPNGGRPYGTPLDPELGTLHDLRFPWQDGDRKQELDYSFEGPCDVCLFASVRQTSGVGSRCALIPPGTFPGGIGSLPDEDSFLLNFPGSVYYRIAGAIQFEVEEPRPPNRNQIPWCTPQNQLKTEETESCNTTK